MAEPIYAKPDLTMKDRKGDGDSGQTWESEDAGQLGDGEDSGQLEDAEDSGQLGDAEDRGEREERVVDIYESADRGDKEERLVDIYESVDQFGILPGPQGDTGDNTAGRQTQGQRSKTMRRLLVEKVAVCLGMLCVLLLVVIIVRENRPADKSAYNQLLENLTQTLQRETADHSTHNQLVQNLNLERDGLQSVLQNLSLEINGLQSVVENLALERDGLQSAVHQFEKEREVTPCPDGWLKFACSCYYKYTGMETWENSRDYCLEKGADLVIINNDVEQEFIGTLKWVNGLSHQSWIGLKKTGGNWTWVDGTPLTTAYWASEDSEVRDCALYSYEHAKWNSAECAGDLYTGICEKW